MITTKYTSTTGTTTSTLRIKGGFHIKKRSKRKLKLPTPTKNSKAEKNSTLKKLRQLQRIINPGYYNKMNLSTLFQNTSNHIFLLEAKLNVLKNLSAMFGV